MAGFNFMRALQVVMTDPSVRAVVDTAANGLLGATETAVLGCDCSSAERGCTSPKIGRCCRCNRTFCAVHGLVYVPDRVNVVTMQANLERPSTGCCIECFEIGMKAASAGAQNAPPRPSPGSRAGRRQQPEPEPTPVPPTPASQVEHCYRVLDLRPGCTMEDVRRRQRELTKRYHPDHCRGDKRAEGRMKSINAAVDVVMRHLQQESER